MDSSSRDIVMIDARSPHRVQVSQHRSRLLHEILIMRRFSPLFAVLFSPSLQAAEPVARSEFIYEKASFPQCHASTIVETKAGLVAAWFGGTREKNRDVGIWLSRRLEDKWTPPVEVANGNQPDGSRLPCWNPVLFQPKTGPLLLFYKVRP